jgi:hypothetical protein
MDSKNNPSSRNSQSLVNMRLASVGGEVGCLTLIIVLIAVFGGIWLDRLLGTKPIITILLVLVSGPISLLLTYLLVTRTMKNINPPQSSEGKVNSSEGGEDR